MDTIHLTQVSIICRKAGTLDTGILYEIGERGYIILKLVLIQWYYVLQTWIDL